MARQNFFESALERYRTRRAERREKVFLSSLPEPYANFFKNFSPQSVQDEKLFNQVKFVMMRSTQPLSRYSEELALIGDAGLLQHIWEKSKTNDVDTKANIVNNPQCPKDVILDAIADPFSEVSRVAVLNPMLNEEDLLRAVHQVDKTCAETCLALEVRLNELGYQVDWAPDGNRDMPGVYKTLDIDEKKFKKIPPEISLGDFVITDLMSEVADNAWHGKEPTTIRLLAGNNVIEISGYTYEPGYEWFSATASFSLNGQVLYGRDSRNVGPYKNEVYQTGVYDNIEDAIAFVKEQIGDLSITLDDGRKPSLNSAIDAAASKRDIVRGNNEPVRKNEISR